jgi:hypothetical protein
MSQSIPFGARSTADQVLAGVDLPRKRMVVTGTGNPRPLRWYSLLSTYRDTHLESIPKTGRVEA